MALSYLHNQADQGTGCPLTMTYAVVPALRHWIAVSLLDTGEGQDHFNAVRVMALYDIITRDRTNENAGVLIRNGSPAVDKIFQNTPWEGRGWERALRALDGAFKLKDPVYFPGGRTKSRCIGIPADYIPDAIETWSAGEGPDY